MANGTKVYNILNLFLSTLLCISLGLGNSESHETVTINGYTHYEELKTLLQNFESTYPNLCKLHSIGQSVENRTLFAIQITDNVNQHEVGEPMFKYVANIHGNEVIGRQITLYLIEYLLKNYGTDDRVTTLVDSTNIFLMPSANPDGFEKANVGDCLGVGGRRNANNVDLNRNFPDQFVKHDEQHREPETLALMQWIDSNPFVLSANLHGGSLVASYPLDDSRSHAISGVHSASPDDDVFKHLAEVYSNNHATMHEGKTCPGDSSGFPNGVTNGAEWYDVPGGLQDYNYVHSNCFEITLELSCCKYPELGDHNDVLITEWENNRESLLAYMEQVHTGVHGFVLNSAGNPITDATISVEGRTGKNVTTTPHGAYWRLLLPSATPVSITASAAGYMPETKSVQITEGGVMMNFTLNIGK